MNLTDEQLRDMTTLARLGGTKAQAAKLLGTANAKDLDAAAAQAQPEAAKPLKWDKWAEQLHARHRLGQIARRQQIDADRIKTESARLRAEREGLNA